MQSAPGMFGMPQCPGRNQELIVLNFKRVSVGNGPGHTLALSINGSGGVTQPQISFLFFPKYLGGPDHQIVHQTPAVS